MRNKLFAFIVLIFMLITSLGVALMLLTNFNSISAIFSNNASAFMWKIAVGLLLLLLCWVALFVVFLRNIKNRDIGKKDSLTGLGNNNYLEKKYKKVELGYNQSLFVSYIAMETATLLKKFDASLSEKIQKDVAQLLCDSCCEDECVGRVGDGAFCMIMHCNDGIHAQQKTIELVNKVNKLQRQILFETISPFRAGIVICLGKDIPFNAVFSNSKIAYEFACDEGKNTCVFSDKLIEKIKSKDNMQVKFREAIKKGEFEPFLQFVRSVKSNKFVGAEVLSRWNSSEKGFVMPAYYIHDMIVAGVIEEFDYYMINRTCELLENFKDDSEMCDLSLSCNVTRITISSNNFEENLVKILKSHDIDRNKLILEITEDAIVDSRSIAMKNMHVCHKQNIIVALDDFGAGNTSFSDLSNYPINHIKVDRDYITKCTTARGYDVLKGIVEFAKNLHMEVLCEGVETKQQLDAVLSIGVDYIQGYYFSYVFSVEEGRNYIISNKK